MLTIHSQEEEEELRGVALEEAEVNADDIHGVVFKRNATREDKLSSTLAGREDRCGALAHFLDLGAIESGERTEVGKMLSIAVLALIRPKFGSRRKKKTGGLSNKEKRASKPMMMMRKCASWHTLYGPVSRKPHWHALALVGIVQSARNRVGVKKMRGKPRPV